MSVTLHHTEPIAEKMTEADREIAIYLPHPRQRKRLRMSLVLTFPVTAM